MSARSRSNGAALALGLLIATGITTWDLPLSVGGELTVQALLSSSLLDVAEHLRADTLLLVGSGGEN